VPARLWFAISVLAWAGGCLYHAQDETDRTVTQIIGHHYDPAPAQELASTAKPAGPDASATRSKEPSADTSHKATPLDIQTTAFIEQQSRETDHKLAELQERMSRVRVPEAIPGSETPILKVPAGKIEQQEAIKKLYPELPPLPPEPVPVPGPNGQPFTLASLQQLAAANSPVLRQAASDVEAARGNLIQAGTYPNPKGSLQISPSNDGSTPGVWGLGVDQVVKTGGKLKLQAAAAEIDLRNAELALRRARSDLATQVRSAYFALIVAKETVRINKALAKFTDEVYRLQADLLRGGFAAPYEPSALRAQAYTTRLAYQQSISAYVYAWKQLVAVVGLRQAPLTDVVGRIDRFIPYYDYDSVLAHVLKDHTDLITARNGLDKARYNLKLAQITPLFPDFEFQVAVNKEFALPPMQVVPTAQVSVPLPVWDLNKGNIIAAEAALVRAGEEPHRVEVSLANSLATAYASYKNNLDALEYYRKVILPDQVRYYRGVFDRRRVDPNAAFGDLVQAQQTLAADVGNYLTILGQLWTSVVQVADFLQTDDLFQIAHPKELPELPDFAAAPWACPHGQLGSMSRAPERCGAAPGAETIATLQERLELGDVRPRAHASVPDAKSHPMYSPPSSPWNRSPDTPATGGSP
jgi:cobalt-zinc-cadmium efflux system outer membrane protein